MSKVMSRRNNNNSDSSNSSSLVDINILSSDDDDSDDFFDRQNQHAQLSGANNNNELIIPMNVPTQFHLNEADSNEEFEMSDGESHFEVEDRLDRESGNGSDSESAAEGNERVLQFDNNITENFILTTIKEWVQAPGVLSMSKLDDLLQRLSRRFSNLPKSYKTLLGNPNINVDNLINDGHFWYMGIKENLDSYLLDEYLRINGKIQIDINIDGLPLFRKSKKKFWPILGKLVGTKNEPFIISIYFGKHDPDDVDKFLLDFINEADELCNNGYLRNDRTYLFSIRHYIFDAPARSLIKCSKGHCGYASCEKCIVWGTRVNNRTVFLDLNAPLRTDESFRNQEQPYHHRGVSPLLRIKAGLVSQFRLDSMHLVYEGVFKRLLEAWIYWPGSWKFHLTIFQRICSTLKQIKSSCPLDFNRPPRSLEELSFFKATEYRRLCIYDGVRVFKEIPDENLYKHFLLLHCGIYILAGPFHQTLNNFANKLLRTFIEHAAVIFEDKFIVYNVHALCHLADECATHGPLDSFSAFQFENKLKSIKETLKSGFRPLEQVAKREMQKEKKVVYLQSTSNKISLLKRHVVPNEILQGFQYRRIIFVVVKFLKTNNEDSDNDEIEYEVGRTKWLVDFNNNNDYIDKTLMILWPPKSSMVCNAVKMDKNPDSSWRTEQVQVKKFYSMF
ncbi:hypothetical protein RF55_16325 [Lasius niger]|uniref:Tpa: transposase domain-containing protein n=1 Tax=Lasius niger TaxID=67767 RepID=A0A0J7K4X7_LASNI|nr:hypothetical protein RF55_16325 [Lasius niger]